MTDYVVPCGKHKGKRPMDLPQGQLGSVYGAYLQVDTDQAREIVKECGLEIARRRALKPARQKSLFKSHQLKVAKHEKWDGVLEASRQTVAELAEIGARREQVLYASAWIGGRPDWEDHVPTRADQE
jgi:Tat protein secretion system quality control protein TatD with DNase activity